MPRIWIAPCLAAALLTPPQAGAQTAEQFYKGKTITLVIGNGPGGGFDVYGRLLGRHIGRYIPGHPNVVVQNMPGAGSLLAANYLYNVAPKDGTAFGLIARNMPLLGLLGDNSNVRYDPRKFTWLGSSSNFSSDAYVLIARKDGAVKSIEDARGPGGSPLLLGGTAEGGTSSDVPRILHDTIGLNMKLIVGYRDSAAIYFAMENGEVHGRMNELSSLRSSRPSWLAPDSPYRLLVQYARATRHPNFPDVPTARELALTDSARALIEFTESPFTMAWPYAAPPGVPEDRARALQEAFAAAHRDPQLLAEAARAGVEVSPVSAGELLHSIDDLSRAPPETFDYVKKLLAAGKGG
ncbi:MAG TPA: tripartite tricarboxylate transporter substrate-binding protein [Steroidobacteraceae bacterium]|jgi:tripartite-type tricarboxylate transporter receptor subunit TctC